MKDMKNIKNEEALNHLAEYIVHCADENEWSFRDVVSAIMDAQYRLSDAQDSASDDREDEEDRDLYVGRLYDDECDDDEDDDEDDDDEDDDDEDDDIYCEFHAVINCQERRLAYYKGMTDAYENIFQTLFDKH